MTRQTHDANGSRAHDINLSGAVMNLDDLNATAGLAVAVCTLLAAFVAWLRWVRPGLRKTRQDGVRIRDAILGRDPVVDSITGKELSPALPGIGQRMAHQEEQMGEMTQAVAQLARTHAQLARMDRTIDDHEGRIIRLEDAAVERVVTRSESAAAWRAVEAVANSTPDDPADNDA